MQGGKIQLDKINMISTSRAALGSQGQNRGGKVVDAKCRRKNRHPGTETSWGKGGGNCTGEVVLALLPEPETVGPVGNGCSFI